MTSLSLRELWAWAQMPIPASSASLSTCLVTSLSLNWQPKGIQLDGVAGVHYEGRLKRLHQHVVQFGHRGREVCHHAAGGNASDKQVLPDLVVDSGVVQCRLQVGLESCHVGGLSRYCSADAVPANKKDFFLLTGGSEHNWWQEEA